MSFWDYVGGIGSGALAGGSAGGWPGAIVGGVLGAAGTYAKSQAGDDEVSKTTRIIRRPVQVRMPSGEIRTMYVTDGETVTAKSKRPAAEAGKPFDAMVNAALTYGSMRQKGKGALEGGGQESVLAPATLDGLADLGPYAGAPQRKRRLVYGEDFL